MSTPIKSAIQAWVASAFADNLPSDQWTLTASIEGQISAGVTVSYTTRWVENRTRTSSALNAGSLADQIKAAEGVETSNGRLAREVTVAPRAWLASFTDRALPGWAFAETRVDTCDGCDGARSQRCGSCSGSGRRTCTQCSNGRIRETCSACNGRGNQMSTRQITVTNTYTGQSETSTEHYYNFCGGGCSSGVQERSCMTCGATGQVPCLGCSGSGRVTCAVCAGAGSRLYRFDRKLCVSSKVAIAKVEEPHPGVHPLLTSRWNTLLTASGTKVETVAFAASGRVATAQFLVPVAVAEVKAGLATG